MTAEVIKQTFKLKSLDGTTKEYTSALTWGKEKKLLKLVGGIIRKFTKTSDVGAEILITPSELVGFFTSEAPDLVTQAVSIITGQSEQDVDEKYHGDDILEFIVPFLMTFIQKFTKTLRLTTDTVPVEESPSDLKKDLPGGESPQDAS